MAFSNNVRQVEEQRRVMQGLTVDQRSFSTLARNSTPDSKSNGNSANVDYGIGSSAWGPTSIWGNGGFGKSVGSSATTREHSRDGLKQGAQNENSNAGLRSTAKPGLDDQWFQPWKSSVGRTMSQIESSEEQVSNQQRSASHATVPSSSSAIASSRPPAISLNTSTTMGPSAHRHATSGTMASRGYEAAPTVYTKHDRQQDPTSKYGRDSAAGGPWNVSPTDTRRPFPPSSRTVSQPMSRNNSQQQTVAGDEGPMFTRPDYGRGQQRQAQSSSHTPSVSSHSNYPFHQLGNQMNQLPLQFGQLSMNGDSRPQTSYRSSDATFSNPMSAGISPLTRSSRSGTRGSVGFDEADDFEGDNHQYSGFSNTLSPLTTNFSAQTYGGRLPPTPIAADFRPSQPFTNGQTSIPTGPKGTSDWQAISSGMNALQLSRSSINPMDQQAIMTPQMQQLLAAQVRAQYGTIFNPYAMPGAIPISGMNPYLPIIPMSFPQVDPATPVQEMPPGENFQSALLFEFKSNAKSKRYELRDLYEHIAEFSGDQHGSRFIQTKLETANSDEKNRVFEEIAPNATQLMTDVFGNYVIQKFFEHGDQTHKKILAAKMKGQVLALSNQMYGCRVVQKALDHVLVDQQAQLIRELDGHVLKCVKDQNGNHVIQKAIERCPAHIIGFVIDAFRGSVQQLSVNSYGCRVIQRCLEHCDGPAKALIMSELMDGIQGMITDQYGNYVVQHVVERDEGEGRRNVLTIVMKSLELYSKHKFASNVVEKCLQCSDNFWRRGVLEKLASEERRGAEGESVLVGMIKDNYGNYVIQKLLDTIHQQDYFLFLEHLQPAVAYAKRSGCGKQIQSVERKMERFSRGGVRQQHVQHPPTTPTNMMPRHPSQLTGRGADFRSGHVKQMPGGAWNAFHPNGLGFMGMGAGRELGGGDAVEGAERR